MRAGAYIIHQSLTAEAAAVLKLALALARRRGHAQVTPLHVAFALLTGPAQPLAAFSPSSSPAAASPAAARYGLLKRACLRSHPPAPPGAAPHGHGHGPLQCRALELCFNVALNRLPASSGGPPSSTAPFTSSSPLIQPSPTLSNALVAALKRAQANQRRGCVELQPPLPQAANGPSPPPQPLLAIKVELDQLAISILDDPSVSRVMQEAGFSSATVKSNLEEETALMPPPPPSSSTPPPPPPPILRPHFFVDPSIGGKGGDHFGLWPAQFMAAVPGSCNDDDVRAVMEVMLRNPEGRRNNPVVVGDSVSMAEAVAGELLRRLERGAGDVPEELAGAHILQLQLSYVHVRLMSRGDVIARAAELRRSIDAVQLQLQRRGGGLVVYVGDLRWALDEDDGSHAVSSYSPVDHMVAELGRLMHDLRASRGRAWLLATASYKTYMRWQQRSRRPLESAWALQAVVVPTGSGTGLSLNSLHSSSVPSASAAAVPPVMVTAQKLGQNPFTMVREGTAFAARDEQDETQPMLCNECTKNYESEASLVKAEDDAEGPRCSLPRWLELDRPPADQTPHEKYPMELKSKWSRLCRKLHLCSDPWWSDSCLLPSTKSEPRVAGFLGLEGLVEQRKSRTGRWSPPMGPGCHGVGTTTTFALSSHPLSDSATSGSRTTDGSVAVRELEQRLRRNIPWQRAAVVAEIAKAVVADDGGKKKGVWLYLKGSDHAAAKRAVTVIAETRCGSADRVVCADASRFSCAEELCSDVVCRASEMGGGKMLVVVVEGVGNAPCDVADCLVAASKSGSLKDHRSGRLLDLSGCIVIMAESKLPGGGGSEQISLRLWAEDEASSDGALKRTTTESPQGQQCKRARHDAGLGRLDLNLICAEDDPDQDDEAVPSDITHEGDSRDDSSEHGQPHGVLEALAARVVTLDKEEGGDATSYILTRLARAIGGRGTGTRVEETAVQAIAAASGQFLEEELESWTVEVLEPAVALATVKNGGKGKVIVLGLGPGGRGQETAGFMGSVVLPSRVQVD